MKKDILSLLLLFCGLSLYGQQYVSVSPSSISVPLGGGTYTCSVDYTISPDSLMSWDLARYTSTSSQVASLTGGWNKQFTVTFKANTGYTPVSGTVTVYYPDPANWNNQVWGTLSFTQPAATPDYTLSIAPSNISVDPYGGTQKLKVSYVYMQEAVNLTYLGATGLPAGCTLSAGTNGELTLRCDKNASGTDRNATVTVRYQNPRDAAKPVTASFRMYQATVPSWIAITPESVTVMGAGEEKSFNLQYAVDSTVTYECLGYSGGQGQIRSYRIANNQLYVDFKKNQTNSTISGNITFNFKDPANSALTLSDAVSFSQAPASYAIRLSENSLAMPAAGTTKTLTASYVERDNPVTLTYKSSSGLPPWCTLTSGANGSLSLVCPANTGNAARSATVTVSYNNPLNASQPVTASFSLSQQPLSYNITIPGNSLSVTAKGETKTLSLAYVDRTGTVNLTYKGCTGLPSGATVTANSNGTFSVAFPGNTTSAVRSGTATVSYNNPLNSSQPVSATFTYSQQPLSYNITIPGNSLSMAAKGETKTLIAAYTERTGPVTLTYKSCTGLPAWCTLTPGANGTLSVVCQSNTGNAVRSASVTVSYVNPLNASQPVTASFSLSQQPLSYAVHASSGSYAIAAEGGNVSVSVVYTERSGSMDLEYRGCTGVPDWCTFTHGGGGRLTLAATRNITGYTRYADLVVSYANPLNSAQPVTAAFSLSQESLSSWITLTPKSIDVGGGGETKTLDIGYSIDSLVGFECTGYSGDQGQVQSYYVSDNRLTVTFKRNTANSAVSGNITFTFKDPVNAAKRISDVVAFSQAPASYAVKFSENSLTVPAAGRTSTLAVSYVERPGPVALGYQKCTGLPAWCKLTPGANGNIALEFSPNEEVSERSGTVTVYYDNPLNASQPVTATVSFTQPPLGYDIVLPLQEIVVEPGGGDAEVAVSYAHRTGPVKMTFMFASFPGGVSLPQQWSVTPKENYNLNLHMDVNNTWEKRTGTIQVAYHNPLDPNYSVQGTFTYSQQPADYSIRFISPVQLNAVAESKTYTLQLGYTSFSGSIESSQIIYHKTEGLPEGSRVTAGQQGQLQVTLPGNDSGAERTGTMVVTYVDPNNSAHAVTASLHYVQPALDYSLQIDSPDFEMAAAGGDRELTVSFSNQTAGMQLVYAGNSGLPEGCTLSAGAGGALTLHVGANTTWAQRRFTGRVSYYTPYDQTVQVSVTFTVTQAPLDYSIAVSPQSITVAPGGESQNLQVAYTAQSGPVTLSYKECTGLPQWASMTAHAGTPGLLTVSFSPNGTGRTLNGRATITYTDGTDEHAVQAYFDYLQESTPYMLSLTPSSLTVSASGGEYMISAELNLDTAYTLTYKRVSDLPPGAEAQAAGSRVNVTFPANNTGTTLQGTFVLTYADPLDAGKELTGTVTYVQPSYTMPAAIPGTVTERSYLNADGSSYNTSVTYMDGLGRPVQTVRAGASPVGGDLIGFVTYDCMGRSDSVSYLPYARTSSGSVNSDPDPFGSQQAFYSGRFGAAVSPYAQSRTVYATGLGLAAARTAPGENHRLGDGYYTRYEYRLNTAADAIVRYCVRPDGSLLSLGTFPAGQLSVRRTVNAKDGTDAQRREVLEYTDPQGRTLASEVRVSATDRRITYYVYDDFGRQRYILPPLGDTFDCSSPKTAQELNAYCYYSEYDEHGLVTRSQSPGADYTLSVYDRRGRLAMSQSGTQRLSNQWSFTKYDVFDRPVLSGVTTGGTYSSHKAALDTAAVFSERRGSSVHGYTNDCYPFVSDANSYLSVTYYDDYDWLAANDPHAFSEADALGQVRVAAAQGLATGSRVKVLGSGTDQWLTTATYYDRDYRTIQSVSDLYPSGVEITSNVYSFTGAVTQAKVKQRVGETEYEYNKWFAYDNFGRLLSIRQQITGDAANGAVTLASYTYDALGNPATKSIHNGAETETYAYDLTGRVTGSSSPSFSYALDYEQSDLPGATPRLDGNISALRWGSGQAPDRAYAYTYDPVGQLASASYRTASSGVWTASEAYAEQNLSYDRHGNLKSLQRTDASGAVLHTLSDMTYDGNRLQSLKLNGSAAVSYGYDRNGNMTSDGRRGVTIDYNLLNFPEQIVAGSQKVTYIYSASGEKLATNANGSLTYYRSVMVYGNDNKLLYILTPEGTVTRNEGSSGTTYTYNYFKRDQVGSTRAVLSAVGTTLQNVQSTDYYPFGLAHSTNNLNKNKYLFSGKELQDGTVNNQMLGLYDFGARSFDPMIGRWLTQDPAQQYSSPYVYCRNNPLLYIDPSGMKDTMVYINGYGFQLTGDDSGNYKFDLKNHTGSVYDPSGRNITSDLYESMITQLDSDLQGFATQRLGFHIGDYNIMGLTTKYSGTYRYTGTGLFTKGDGGVLGYFDPRTSIAHIAPSLVYEMYDSREAQWNLLAVLTHELLHGVHRYLNGSHYDSELSEAATYQATFDVYTKGGFFNQAYGVYNTYQSIGYSVPMGHSHPTSLYPSQWVKPINYPKSWEYPN
ncbi:BACON domain-containing protein [Alistipes indistinctus]|uniref:BACON domain-containing protein n=2 Tax=Alistipes indistinctus TaxID=626932 RepID=UPI003AB133E7